MLFDNKIGLFKFLIVTLIFGSPFSLLSICCPAVGPFASTIAVSRTENVVNPRAKRRAINIFVDKLIDCWYNDMSGGFI